MPRKPPKADPAKALREIALSYPEASEEFPWGHAAFKVRGKTFLFTATEEGVFSLSAKLPVSGVAALMLPFASPTGYGLGKSGWVTARFGPEDEVPLEILESWLAESYRAIAPKKLVAQLPGS